MKFTPYLIECITNLHVGSGDNNYGIVDNLVQRDPVTGHPTIHASSLKGGLKEHATHQGWENLREVFGDDDHSGNVKFLGADLVALPVRCTYDSYVLAVSGKQWEELNKKSGILTGEPVLSGAQLKEENLIFTVSNEEIYAEEFKLTPTNAQRPEIPGLTSHAHLASFSSNDFAEISKRLPVIARNKLGENKNLWYEEIVPHKTVFLTFVGAPEPYETFLEKLNGSLVQLGANSSVGYGLCNFYKIELKK